MSFQLCPAPAALRSRGRLYVTFQHEPIEVVSKLAEAEAGRTPINLSLLYEPPASAEGEGHFLVQGEVFGQPLGTFTYGLMGVRVPLLLPDDFVRPSLPKSVIGPVPIALPRSAQLALLGLHVDAAKLNVSSSRRECSGIALADISGSGWQSWAQPTWTVLESDTHFVYAAGELHGRAAKELGAIQAMRGSGVKVRNGFYLRPTPAGTFWMPRPRGDVSHHCAQIGARITELHSALDDLASMDLSTAADEVRAVVQQLQRLEQRGRIKLHGQLQP